MTTTAASSATSTLDAFIDRYMAMWNEADPVRRRTFVEELWAPDAGNYTQSIEAVGHDAIEARVTRSFEMFVGTGVHRFQPHQQYAAHHGAVRVWWEMVTVADGTVAATGHEFLLLDAGGRIVSDHQFPVAA